MAKIDCRKWDVPSAYTLNSAMRLMIYNICSCFVQKHMISGNGTGEKIQLTYLLQAFMIILKNVYSLDSVVLVMIY